MRINHWEGYCTHRKNRQTATTIVMVLAEEGGLDTESGKYALICNEHSEVMHFDTRKVAAQYMAQPQIWCTTCGRSPDTTKKERDKLMDKDSELQCLDDLADAKEELAANKEKLVVAYHSQLIEYKRTKKRQDEAIGKERWADASQLEHYRNGLVYGLLMFENVLEEGDRASWLLDTD